MFVADNYADHSKFSVYLQASVFIFLSGMVHFLFYFRLILPIPCTQVDPGFVTREIEDRILAENGLTRNLVTGNVLDWEDICVLLNEAYFKRQGLLPGGDESFRDIESSSVQLQSIQNYRKEERRERQQRLSRVIYDNFGYNPTWGALGDFMRYRYCKSCEGLKPPRSHHCSICGRCVMRMEHHCPWVGRCVGHQNYRFFYQFLAYTVIALQYTYWSIKAFHSKIV
jgi:hypothetical protein